jgi:hypothetical protein
MSPNLRLSSMHATHFLELRFSPLSDCSTACPAHQYPPGTKQRLTLCAVLPFIICSPFEDSECVELYLHSPIRLHGIVLSQAQGQWVVRMGSWYKGLRIVSSGGNFGLYYRRTCYVLLSHTLQEKCRTAVRLNPTWGPTWPCDSFTPNDSWRGLSSLSVSISSDVTTWNVQQCPIVLTDVTKFLSARVVSHFVFVIFAGRIISTCISQFAFITDTSVCLGTEVIKLNGRDEKCKQKFCWKTWREEATRKA